MKIPSLCSHHLTLFIAYIRYDQRRDALHNFNISMIYRQLTIFLIVSLIAFGLALPLLPPYQVNPNASTPTALSSTSRPQVTSTAAPFINQASSHLLAATKSIAANHNLSSQTDSSTPSQPQWSPGDISTVVFGCIASILGVLALYLTLWLGRRSPGCSARYGMYFTPGLNASILLTVFSLQMFSKTPNSPIMAQSPMLISCHSNASLMTHIRTGRSL